MKNLLRLLFFSLLSLSVSTLVAPAQNYNLVSDSLAFGAVSRQSVDSVTSGLHDGGTSDIAMVHAPLWAAGSRECDENHDS